jgi:hypothetical protein
VVEGALEVPKDVLRSHEIGLTRVVHVEAHLLDRVGNVGPSEGEVLESPGQATIGSWVTDEGPHVKRDLGGARLCSRSCQHTQGCPEYTSAGGGRGRQTVALLRHKGSGAEGCGPSS